MAPTTPGKTSMLIKVACFYNMALAVSWKVNKLPYSSGQSDVRPRKFDIFTLIKKKLQD